MKPSPPSCDWRTLDEFVEAFEVASRQDPTADWQAFLPDEGHPQFADILLELARVDLEQRWDRGHPRPLDDYLAAHGRWLSEPAVLEQIAFEEFRARRQAGQTATPADYEKRYGVSTRNWPACSELEEDAIDAAPFPQVGTAYLGFELLAELGRGALSRVYLARQDDLAQRLVALKVSTASWAEADKLAQLQHAHIVPIYSVHRDGPRCAVCMPYFGAATLADVVRNIQHGGTLPTSGLDLLSTLSAKADRTWLAAGETGPHAASADARLPHARHNAEGRPDLQTLSGLSYAQAVLWLGVQLAAGLAHAHQRGIVHRDLKPANILLADDGRPMLLDFNLSQDTKRDDVEAVAGGTLPYMSPEQIVAFQARHHAVDPRSDIYSLGVILFELLAGKAPFPLHDGTLDRRTAASLQDRLGGPPALVSSAASVTPAVQAIVHRCLAPRPEERYQTAEELREDLQRQLDHLPLRHATDRSPGERWRKWVRRHPRVTSAGGVAALATAALLLVGGLAVVRQGRLERLQAVEELRGLQTALLSARTDSLQSVAQGRPAPDELLARCRQALERAGATQDGAQGAKVPVGKLSAQDAATWRTTVGELWQLTAAVAETQARRTPETAQAALVEQAQAYRQRAADSIEAADDLGPAALQLSLQRRYRDALPLWQKATATDPQQVWAWYGLATCQTQREDWRPAIASLTACIALAPDFAAAYAARGAAQLNLHDFAAAQADLDRALALSPELADARINHALALVGQGRADDAERELSAAIERDETYGRLYLIRAQVRRRQGNQSGAAADEQAALRCPPRDEHDWIARGIAQLAHDPQASLASFDAAAQANPASLPARENRAHVLSERLDRTEEAITVLDSAVRDFPDSESAYAARGVLLARLGRRDAAIQDARQALRLRDSAAVRYHVAGIYSQTAASNPLDKLSALALLASALGQGYGEDLLEHDADLDPLRSDEQFQSLVQAARLLKSAAQAAPADPTDSLDTSDAHSE